ncbi:MAG: retroviral-like aspartic protease family protein [Paramuribaculum sp.]|nr:retroviral-like aspartic protease family protein [Paramuribaculum sp.]
MYADRKDGCIGMMPIRQTNPIFVEAVPGILFRFDTGSDISSITESDLEKLKSMGAEVKTSVYPVMGRDGEGKTRVYMTRYTVSLPLHQYVFDTDTDDNRTEDLIQSSRNFLHNVDFAPSDAGFSVLGIDFIERFKMEYQCENNLIALYTERPEEYVDLVELEVSSSPLDEIWLGHRYYTDLTIDRKTDSYFLDTGLQDVQLRLPSEEKSRTRRKMNKGQVHTLHKTFEAMIDPGAWMEIGDRVGTQTACYYDTNEEDFAFNPLNLFNQDVLLDFGGRAIALKPFCAVPERTALPPDTIDNLITETGAADNN